MAPLKVDCTSGLVIEILYYLNQVGVTSISLLNAHIATKRFILVQRWGFRINMLTPFTAFSEKKTTTQDKSLGRVEGGTEPLDLIELLSLYKIAPFYGVSTYGALALEIETFSVFQFFKVLSIALSTSL